jgi:hypothetical protein
MSTFFPFNSIRKICALVAVTLVLPALAYAGHDKDKGDKGDKGNKGEHRGVPVVPEANAGWVLVPFFGVVLLYSARHLFRGKATE